MRDAGAPGHHWDTWIVVTAILVAALPAACSAPEEPRGLATTPESGATPAGQASPSGDPAGSSTAADIAELEALYLAFWEAFVDVSNNPRIDAELFAGITTDSLAEEKLSYVDRELIANDVRREGEPEISGATVTVEGDTAQVEACFDERTWKVLHEGKEVDWEFSAPEPAPMSAERTEDGWLLTGNAPQEEATITC